MQNHVVRWEFNDISTANSGSIFRVKEKCKSSNKSRFLLVSCMAYSLTLKVQSVLSSESSAHLSHYMLSYVFIITTVRTPNPACG
jgi:hypothetical protein